MEEHRNSPNSAALKISIMTLLLLMGVLNTGLVGPNRLSIEREYGLAHSHFGLGLAVVQVSATLVLFAATRFVERFNPVHLLAVSQLMQALGLALIFATHSLVALVAGWAVTTVAMRLNSISNSLSMALWPREPRKGVILLHAYNALGKLTGPLLVAVCIVLGWRFSFLVTSAVCALTFLALVGLSVSGRAQVPHLGTRPHGSSAFHRPLYWVGITGITLIAGSETVFLTLYPTYLEEVHRFTPSMASLAFSVHLAGLAAGRFIAAYFLGKRSDNFIIGACVVSSALIFPALWADMALIRYASLFVFGFAFSATWPVHFARLSAFFPGEGAALSYGAGFASVVGISLAVLGSSYVADFDMTAALLISSAVMVGFGVLYYGSPLGRAGTDSVGQ